MVAGLWISQNPPPSASVPFYTKPHILNSSGPCSFLALSPGPIAGKPCNSESLESHGNSTIPGKGHTLTLVSQEPRARPEHTVRNRECLRTGPLVWSYITQQ